MKNLTLVLSIVGLVGMNLMQYADNLQLKDINTELKNSIDSLTNDGDTIADYLYQCLGDKENEK